MGLTELPPPEQSYVRPLLGEDFTEEDDMPAPVQALTHTAGNEEEEEEEKFERVLEPQESDKYTVINDSEPLYGMNVEDEEDVPMRLKR